MLDFGTGGLDLAYEVMRGYDALVLVDISRQGEPPGTIYVMEPDPADVDGRDRGRCRDRSPRDGSADRAALREGRGRLAGQGGWIVACEPSSVGEVNWGLSKPVEDAVDRAVGGGGSSRVQELRNDAAYVKEH